MKQDWNADLYEEKHAFVYQYGREVLNWLNPQEGERILDLGCGTGQLTAEIANTGCDVIGIDKSPEMVKKSRGNYWSIEFLVRDAADFAFDKPFDAVFSNATLHWVNDAVGVAQSVHAALKTGGRFVAEFGGEHNVENIISALKESLEKRGIWVVRKNGPWYFPSMAEYAYLLEKNGFAVKRIHHIERPTTLADEKTGIRDWLSMFGEPFLAGIEPNEKEEIMLETQERLRPTNFIKGKWTADYYRLRVEAVKGNGNH